MHNLRFPGILKPIFIVASLLATQHAFGQDSLSVDVVKKYTYPIIVKDGKLSGQGWDSLKGDIAISQFVLLGESHASPKLSELTTAVLSELKPFGFGHFITETGPVASGKLLEFYNPDETIFSQNIRGFLTDNKLEMGSPPAEFITMKRDVPMYKAAIENGFKIQGIDREYYSSTKYLFTELRQFCKSNELKTLYEKATLKLAQYQADDISKDETLEHIIKCNNDTEIQLFLQSVSNVNPRARFIVDEIRTSHLVYGLYAAKKYGQSESTRIANFKTNFGKYYRANTVKDPANFKAFIKMGNMHTSKGESYLGYYDIGNAVYQLAALNGTRSLHIENMRRYRFGDNGEVKDFLKNGFEPLINLVSQSDKEKWMIINLNELREEIISKKLRLTKDERNTIMKNDWLLLTPVDEAYKQSLNYE